jgi:hypothetical protein
MTVQKAPPLSHCDSDNWTGRGDPFVQVTWSSGVQDAYGTVVFDGENFPILSGVEDQFLCLYVAYPGAAPSYECGDPDPYCLPGVTREQFDIAGSQRFVAQASPGGGGDPGGGGSGAGSGGSGGTGGSGSVGLPSTKQAQTPSLSKAVALSKAKSALRRKYGRAYKRGRKHLACRRQSARKYSCSFTVRYRGQKRTGTVTVRLSATGIETRVKPH